MYLCFPVQHPSPFTNTTGNIHPLYPAMSFQVPVVIHPHWVNIFTLWQLPHAKTSVEYIVCHYVKDYHPKPQCTGWVSYPKMDKKLEYKCHQNQPVMTDRRKVSWVITEMKFCQNKWMNNQIVWPWVTELHFHRAWQSMETIYISVFVRTDSVSELMNITF